MIEKDLPMVAKRDCRWGEATVDHLAVSSVARLVLLQVAGRVFRSELRKVEWSDLVKGNQLVDCWDT